MNEKEVNFQISKEGDKIVISSRVPFKWKEILVIGPLSFVILILMFGWFVGTWVSVLSNLGYIIYRFAAWFYYSNIIIDSQMGELTIESFLFGSRLKSELISNAFRVENIVFKKMARSGKTKYLMSYRRFTDKELLIIRNSSDKERIKKSLGAL